MRESLLSRVGSLVGAFVDLAGLLVGPDFRCFDETGNHRPNDDFGFHHDRYAAGVTGQPHSDIPFVEENSLERHDHQDPNGLHLSPRSSDPIGTLHADLYPIVLLVCEFNLMVEPGSMDGKLLT